MSSLIEKLINYLKKQVITILINNLKRKLRNLIKTAILAILGYTIIITGLIFVCLGIVKYLSDVLHLPFWYSSLISGVILLLIGLSSLLIAYSRLRF
ncbi:MAG: phage holin family protein [Candidatus Bathyarchaeia archaeon]|nr:phage holin family protein [Candidatus Bathyarchaeota archaeon]